jgi:hypothetical protein
VNLCRHNVVIWRCQMATTIAITKTRKINEGRAIIDD